MSLGSLVLFRKMTDEQYDIFIQQLSDTVGFKLDLLRKIISNSIKNGENENILFLRILDAFAGTSITFPKRRQSFQYLDKTLTNYDYPRNVLFLLMVLYYKRIIFVNRV